MNDWLFGRRLAIKLTKRRRANTDMGRVLTTFLLMVIALALTPTVQEQVTAVTGAGAGNLTGAALAICLLVPLFWVISIIGIGVGSIYYFLKT